MVVARATRCCSRAREKRERKERRKSEERGWEMASGLLSHFESFCGGRSEAAARKLDDGS